MTRLNMLAMARRASGWHHRSACAMLLALALALAAPAAHAHLMVAQHGTLNLVDAGGFAVVAVPVSALEGVDDDGDGRLSVAELRAHAGAIEAQVQRGLQLVGHQGSGPLPLQGLLLNLSPDDSASTAPAGHLVVMGRFALADASPQSLAGLKLRYTLFGPTAQTQQLTVTVSHGSEAQQHVFSPEHTEAALFPSAWAVLWDNAALGAEHVLGGLDHLLFLLVVLATGWGWRRAAAALSVFTAGHAITLAAVAVGGLSVPARVVEPAIAATIIGMALFDRWSSTRRTPPAPAWRLGLIFICALIHGLGLAGALGTLGLDPANRLLSLLGFNAGIEAAQVGVALATGVVAMVLRPWRGVVWLAGATRLASHAAVLTGSVWLAQRAFWA